eukprot:264848_1
MSSSSFVGLKNQGATCYLNSLIQTLFLTPEFRMELFSLTESEVGLNLNKRKRVIVELQKLFARLQSPDLIGSYCPSFALSTKSLTNSFGWNAAQVMDQHDINELYNLLLDGIERQMPHNKKILNKYYKGRIINVIECTQCHYASKREEDFAQLNVILQNMNASFDDLQESLVSMYLDNEEELKNENAYFCPNCNDKVRAKKYCRLIQLPSIMVCNFNRFYYDLESGGRAKIDKKFKFPKSLDCSMFVEHEYSQMAKDVLCEYDLIAVVVHRGEGANAGHYHAFIRDMNDEVDWTAIQRNKKKRSGRRRRRRNNTNNKKTKNRYDDKEETKREKKDEATAILVSILSEHEMLTKNRLQNEFKNMTNLDGWYTYQQLGLGSFAQFVRNNPRFKIINGDMRSFSVCLAHNSNNLNGFETDIDDEYMPQQNTNNRQATQPQEQEEKINDPNAAHWFDFNDEHITAVSETKIAQLYNSGNKECPYIVIYRRKSMNAVHWPPEAPSFVSRKLEQDRVKSGPKRNLLFSDSDDSESSSSGSSSSEDESSSHDGSNSDNNSSSSSSSGSSSSGDYSISDSSDSSDSSSQFRSGPWEPIDSIKALLWDSDGKSVEWIASELKRSEMDVRDKIKEMLLEKALENKNKNNENLVIADPSRKRKLNDGNVSNLNEPPKKNKNNRYDKEQTKREKKDEATAILVSILSEHEMLTKNRLQNEFKNMTNLDGWYTYQQLGLGSFAQFVRNNHRFKIINGDKRSFSVCLAHNNSNNLNGFIVCDGDDGTDEEYMPQQNTNNKPQTEQEEHKCNDANAAHWFDFNDEDITAVFDTEIDDLYDGGDAECPYMVIYRRKCMNTGNWPPQIPIYVSSLLIDEPLDAEEDEQQIDIAILKLSKPNAEPKKKKRKVSAPSNHDQSSLANLPHPNGKRKKRKAKATQQVESEYLEGIRMKKGATVSELYSRVSEWSGIAANDLLIAQIVCKGRSRLRNAKVEDLGTCDKETKLRLVPMESDILIWDSSKYGTELAAKELQRRKKCIALNVYILSRASPCIIYVNPNNDRLRDVWSMIRSQLSGDERELMKDGNGRFRDVDTHSLFGAEDEMKFVSCLRIDAASVLRFEAPNAPSADEFVIRYRLKTGKVSAKECDEKEAYIAESECIETLFAMMCSAFDVDSTQFDLRKARSDWAVNRIIEVDKRLIKDCKFDHTQRLILAQKNCNKNMRSIQIYCETDVDAFKLGAAAKDEAHDGLDIYECNSVVLCSLDVDRRSTGLEIKRAIIEECDMKMDPCRLRISIVTQNGSRTKWHILNSNKQIGGHSGKCCVELSSCDDTEYGNKASGKALIFVHEKMASDGDDECAHYGPRHEIQITQTQREKRDALKAKIMQELGIEKDEKITIANRNIATHEWTILKQKIIKPRLYDRDIVAVAMHPIDTSKQFETKYDRHCQTQIKEKDNSDAEQDEPVMRINFVNDEENNDKLD